MKKILLILILSSSGLAGYSPNSNTVFIELGSAINPYLRIAEAISEVESSGNDNAFNELEVAVGRYQIRPVLIEDYYQEMGLKFTISEMYDSLKAKQVFMYYATKYHYTDIESISRCWNGGATGMTKTSTIEYYQKVLSKLK